MPEIGERVERVADGLEFVVTARDFWMTRAERPGETAWFDHYELYNGLDDRRWPKTWNYLDRAYS